MRWTVDPNIECALLMVDRLFAAGWEWPDAVWKACCRYGIQYEDLADAYDEKDRNRFDEECLP